MFEVYKVKWWMMVEAESPEDAAFRARNVQLDPSNVVTIFTVTKQGEDEGVEVDLLNLPPVWRDGGDYYDYELVYKKRTGEVLGRVWGSDGYHFAAVGLPSVQMPNTETAKLWVEGMVGAERAI